MKKIIAALIVSSSLAGVCFAYNNTGNSVNPPSPDKGNAPNGGYTTNSTTSD